MAVISANTAAGPKWEHAFHRQDRYTHPQAPHALKQTQGSELGIVGRLKSAFVPEILKTGSILGVFNKVKAVPGIVSQRTRFFLLSLGS